jgi:hypothetical protein
MRGGTDGKGHAMRWRDGLKIVLCVLALMLGCLELCAASDSQLNLPFVSSRWPPLPGAPTLQAIDNPGQVGDYAVTWDAPALAESYELQERLNEGEWAIVYLGTNTLHEVHGRPAGTYHYRVRAQNAYGYGSWSDEQTTLVGGQEPGTISRPPSSGRDLGGQALVSVVNDCPYALRLEFTGPEPDVLNLPRCEVCKVYSYIGPIFCPTSDRPSDEILISPGIYRVYVSVDATDVIPYIGQWELEGDRRYTLCFYVLRR